MKQRVEENGFDIWLESSVPEILPDDIVKQAKGQNCQMIISHHPLCHLSEFPFPSKSS